MYHCWSRNKSVKIASSIYSIENPYYLHRNYPVTREVSGQGAQLVISVGAHCVEIELFIQRSVWIWWGECSGYFRETWCSSRNSSTWSGRPDIFVDRKLQTLSNLVLYFQTKYVVLHRKPCICDNCWCVKFPKQKNSSNVKGFLRRTN